MEHFEEYKKQTEPEKYQKAENWGIAIGLQRVDNLTPSKYLIEVAKDNIEGKISIDEAGEQITQYYKKNPAKTLKEHGEKEADEVSARITKLLSTHSFSFSPAELISIHKALFTGVLDHKIAGQIRDYDITKEEPILNGDTVVYGRADSIRETLDYDFSQEKKFNYKGLSKREKVEQLAKFTSGIWQIHPFGEGNTRATTVFIIKYLYTLGFETNNDMFKEHARYFRNALVRANYQNLAHDIPYTMEFLNKFFGNLLLDEKNLLDNREMQIKSKVESKEKIEKSKEKSKEKIMRFISENPQITTNQLAEFANLSVAGVEKNLRQLKEKNLIRRIGPDKGGHWEVVEKLEKKGK
ncbi:MAG: winged helix-turn-helix transcriptional regulator [Alphaproteobacteria bacterium]|nr:winged helix-turn-helix transcriptional regulator [Alphaproteobacteria bacterium]